MECIQEAMTDVFTKAVHKAYPDIPDPPVPLTLSTQEMFGDYQCNAAMPLVGLLKAQGKTGKNELKPKSYLFCI